MGLTEIGLISDTHGLLRPAAVSALAGVERIIHAGDVGRPEILESLASIAPVLAVRGNVDRGAWAERLPASAHLEVGGASIHVLHVLEDLDFDPATADYDVVIFGHTHEPKIERRAGVLYVNPGSAGPRRFRLPVSIGRLSIGPEGAEARVWALEP